MTHAAMDVFGSFAETTSKVDSDLVKAAREAGPVKEARVDALVDADFKDLVAEEGAAEAVKEARAPKKEVPEVVKKARVVKAAKEAGANKCAVKAVWEVREAWANAVKADGEET